ncbi:hypothetical protein COU59_00290 [Candidatus Pacearchaeota archaeon CG10_big_fil_rev_8_21_14_0_10_34_12]|nr:MAG: hypothetical protein COU59_00290 [Candidatus Pacearchaeota archaeon CG10_big_fil_rev_8_21_14_0_10_34_12]
MNNEIAEGIKFAMSRGESLQQAMQTFYNAGYSRQEVEEAAKAMQYQLHQEKEQGIHAVHPEFKKPVDMEMKKEVVKSQEPKKTEVKSPLPSIQKISGYESSTQGQNPRKKMIILVSILLGVLILIFAGIFFFKDTLLGLLGNVLG